jgi:hypothetical protein
MPRFRFPAAGLVAAALILPGLAAAQPAPGCTAERERLAAEATTPGIVQRLMQEALALCEQQAAAARPPVSPVAAPQKPGQAPAGR